MKNHEVLFIIGAPRSGTNMLRDMLTQLPGVGTWPCDEINYIWRHGNVGYPSDEFTTEMATIKVQSYIREKFKKISEAYNLEIVVEKTCANSLRVNFVNKVIPEAKYIFIVRDGMDAVGSAIKRWKAKVDIYYILKKSKYVPPTDLPYYASRYLFNQLHRLFSKERRLSFWGPAIENIDGLLKEYSLAEVCALQWQTCVEHAERAFAIMPTENILRVKYEDFVVEPVTEFARLAGFINRSVPDSVNKYLKENVRQEFIGKGRQYLGESEIKNIRPLIASTLERYGYA